jgi:sugar O-acyltransferase (sialic acid O-acetyltransferase NeuD family)
MAADLHVIGSGGHATVVIATAEAAGFRIASVHDDAESRWGQRVLGHAVAGPTSAVLEDPSALAVLAIGDNTVRRRLAVRARCRFATVIHPTAVVHPSVVIGEGVVIFAGVIVQPRTTIGAHGILNTACSVDHDCVLGEVVHLAPGVRLAGSVRIGEGGFLGIGSVVIPGISIGGWTTVGAGAAVARDLDERVVAVGVPARPRERR